MPQTITFLDEKEDKKIKKLSKQWKLSKAEGMRKIIRDFKED